ncbi:apolipoprotein N-acyltransferase [uncultured Nocardioides sp.]|uniref:apolipoprotein N-acyltransferase n=1 Tax=uncultured Nocardioides sp. TaxID=198441 RepID=UPI002603D9FB|nr:apolipoprotein N-acyltransferase [uncultured Nocardioides sp.]
MPPAPATPLPTRTAQARETTPSLVARPLRRHLLARLAATSLVGVAAAGASAPWEHRWLLPLAVAALVLLLQRVPLCHAFLLGLLFGLGFTLALTAWMRAVGTDAWLLLSPVVAAYYALAAVGIALVSRLRGWPWWTAGVWVAVETAMSAWPLGGFPWTRMAWATVDTPFALWLPWVGATGVSFLVALTGATLAWVICEGRARPVRAVLVIGAALLVGSVPVVFTPESLTLSWEAGLPTVTVAAVQGDVPGAGNDLVAVHEQVTENHVQATVDLAQQVQSGAVPQPDFVLWPENSTAVDPLRDEQTNSVISRAAAAIGVPVLVGAIVDGPRPDAVLNQGLVWLPDGSTGERYTKRHPVPFGEYVPFRSQLSGLRIGRLDMVPRDMIAGTRTRPLDIAGIRVADLICFDVAFDDSVTAQIENGAQLVTVQTSNATFTGTPQLQQQFTISRARAMETGRTVVVASTNGISGVIGPDGTVLDQLAPRTTDIAVAQVPLIDARTPAVRYGSLIGQLLSLVGVAAIITAAAAPVRRRLPRVRRLRGWRTRRHQQDPS